MSPVSTLGVHIQIPAEAVIPLAIVVGVVLVLVLAGSGFQNWKTKHSKSAQIVAAVIAVALTGVAIYFLVKTLTETEQNHPVYKGIVQVGFIEGPIAGGFAALAAMLWRFAGQRWIALATGLGIGAALISKPLVWPLVHESYNGAMHQWGLMDPEHLSFMGPGIVALVVGLVLGLRRR